MDLQQAIMNGLDWADDSNVTVTTDEYGTLVVEVKK